jgi:hypothetical protein
VGSSPPAAACEPIDLHAPDGTRVDLTGTWRGGPGVHFVRQDGDCVWWVSMSTTPGQERGAEVLVLFRGKLAPDFTLNGEWMSVIRPFGIPDPRRGSVPFALEFLDPLTGDEALVLRSQEGIVGPFTAGVTLRYEGPLPPAP